ncbi:NADH-cytochrome b5 reductase [Catenaria anguillulae PL171]|uniref:NADH-cytochrome b5 reductase n=1 Tax=Catenaria anguillulae PL171 TaxID=765915 RepID=A0A1Y2H932_9FUNG|nr:NADH-cytochrome b5 reductase [Catenaria anguillulae PL171]
MSSSTSAPTPAAAVAANLPAPLSPDEFRAFKVREIQPISHNTALYRFELPHPEQTIGMPTTSFVLTKFTPAGSDKPVVRPYTPTNTDDAKGHFDLVVKTYPNGAMSSHIASLKPGDTLEVKGPIVKYPLAENQHKEIAMIAGGTGITPMLQIINKVLRNPADKTKLTLLFGNISEKDVLLKDHIDALVKQHPGRLNVVYTIDKADNPAEWKGETGHINKDKIKKYIPAPTAENVKVFVCGPPGMLKAISGSKAPDFSQGELDGLLKELGYTKDQVFKV